MLGARFEQPHASAKKDVPESAPILLVTVDEQDRVGIGLDVSHARQAASLNGFRLPVDRVVQDLADQDEADRNQRGLFAVGRGEVTDARRRYLPPNLWWNHADAVIIGQSAQPFGIAFALQLCYHFLMTAAQWLRARAVELGAAICTAGVLLAGLAVGVPFLRARIPEVFLYGFCCICAVVLRAVIDLAVRSVVFAAHRAGASGIVIPALSRYPASVVR